MPSLDRTLSLTEVSRISMAIADDLNLDATDTWPGVGTYDSDSDSIGMLLIDTCGLEYLQFVIYDADGSGTEANDITVYGRPY